MIQEYCEVCGAEAVNGMTCEDCSEENSVASDVDNGRTRGIERINAEYLRHCNNLDETEAQKKVRVAEVGARIIRAGK